MKKAKRERKYTLSGQMTAIFIGLLVFILIFYGRVVFKIQLPVLQ